MAVSPLAGSAVGVRRASISGGLIGVRLVHRGPITRKIATSKLAADISRRRETSRSSAFGSAVSSNRCHCELPSKRRQHKRNVELLIAVEQNQQRIAVDRLAMLVHVDVLAVQLHAQATHERHVPGLLRHFLAVGIEPQNVGNGGAFQLFAVEEPAALQHRLAEKYSRTSRRVNSSNSRC